MRALLLTQEVVHRARRRNTLLRHHAPSASSSMTEATAAGRKFLLTLVDRIAAQWEVDEIEIPAEDFGRLLRRTVNSLPDAPLKTELLAHLAAWESDAWKRFCEKRQTTIHKPAVVVVPADPNLFLASGRKQLLDKLAAAKSDKTSDYERIARAALEPTELPIAAAIFEQLNRSGSPAERIERIVRFAISQPDELREAVIGPFSLAAEQLPVEQAAQACQRFIPLLTMLSSSPSLSHHVSDSIDSLAGLYVSSLSLTGKADIAKLNALNLMLPSLSWLRAAVAVSVPREKPSAAQLSFLLRVYSLALNSLSASPSSVEYLRATIVCNRGCSLASASGRSAEEREFVRLHEKAAVPLAITPLIPSLVAARPAPNAGQLYATLVAMSDADLLKALALAEEAAVVARTAASAEASKATAAAPEVEELDELPAPAEDGVLFFTDKTRSEKIRSRLQREEGKRTAAEDGAAKASAPAASEADEEAELNAAIAASARKLKPAAGAAEVGLSDTGDDESEDRARKGPVVQRQHDDSDGEGAEDDSSAAPPMPKSKPQAKKAAAPSSEAGATKAPRRKRREAEVLQEELELLALNEQRKSARKTGSTRELRSGKRTADDHDK